MRYQARPDQSIAIPAKTATTAEPIFHQPKAGAPPLLIWETIGVGLVVLETPVVAGTVVEVAILFPLIELTLPVPKLLDLALLLLLCCSMLEVVLVVILVPIVAIGVMVGKLLIVCIDVEDDGRLLGLEDVLDKMLVVLA